MSRGPGLAERIWRYVRGFLRYSVLFTGLTVIAALPAFVVALTWFPNAIGYLLIGVAMVSIMSVGGHLQPEEETDDDSFDTEKYDGHQLLFFAVAMYAVLASGISAILFTGATVAWLASSLAGSIAGVSYVGTPTAGVVVAALFPLFDSELGKRFDRSVGKYGVLGAVRLLHTVGVLHGTSTDQFERTVHRGLM